MKRLFDLVVASLGLLLLGPVFATAAVAVKLTSAGPVFYRAQRVGQGGRPFAMLKFRSMYVLTDRGSAITRAGDKRVTPVGRVLRRLKADELPQLINVLRGEMSLVGPRPEDPHYVAMYDAAQRAVLDVKPGMTSAASLEYRDEESRLAGEDFEQLYVERIMPEKLRIDLEYLRRRSFVSDLQLIMKTVAAVLGRR